MKMSPTTRTETVVDTGSMRMQDFLSSLRKKVDEDNSTRRTWLQDKRYWRRRRYGKEHRMENYPWPGGSEIVMPLIDMTIDRLKASLASFIANRNPPVTVLGTTQQEMKQAPTIEMFFEWLVRSGSPNFLREMFLGLDDLFECGRMVVKSIWDYQTRVQPEVLSRRTLPQELRKYVSVGSDRDAQTAMMLTGMEFQSNKSFRARQKDIKRDISMHMDLDPEESKDQAALEKIMKWLYEGAEGEIIYNKKDTLHDAPAIVAVDPEHLIVPAHTTSIENAEHITHEMMLSETEIRSRAKDYKWNQAVVDKRLKAGPAGRAGGGRTGWEEFFNSADDYDTFRQQQNRTYRLYETCTYFDANRDGRDEKIVTLWFADFDEAPLKTILYSRPSGRWPYHTCEFELNSRYWYQPRGVPETMSDLDWEITAQHRAKLNRMTIANAPVFMYRMHRNINPENLRWIPGQMIPVMDPTDVAPMQIPNLDMSFEREEQILKTWAEQRTGATDFSLANQNSSMTEPRTRYEIQAIQSAARSVMGLRGALFQKMLQEIYDEFFDLWQTYGPDEVYVRVTGEEPLMMTKEDLQGDFMFIVTGAIGEDDPELKAQKAMARLQLLSPFLQNPQMMGMEYELNAGELVMDYLEHDDIRAARRIVRKRTPQEIAQLKQEQEQQTAIQGMLTGARAAGASA